MATLTSLARFAKRNLIFSVVAAGVIAACGGESAPAAAPATVAPSATRAVLPTVAQATLSPAAVATGGDQGNTGNGPRPGENELVRQWSRGQCEGNGPVTFEVAPFPADQVGYILPLGLMTGGHVTPVDHQYYAARGAVAGDNDVSEATDVLALADGYIVEITHRTQVNEFTEAALIYER